VRFGCEMLDKDEEEMLNFIFIVALAWKALFAGVLS
jgi:hypothetical protein